MKKKICYLFVFDGLADWEVAHATVGINKSEEYMIRTIAIEKTSKVSMGGVKIVPDYDFIPEVDLSDITQDNTGMLILPGGRAWEERGNEDIAPLVNHCIESGIPVAAICGATLMLADRGWLDAAEHTSNDLSYLESLSLMYSGSEYYQNRQCVRSGNLITAGGTAGVEFAKEIFNTLNVLKDSQVRDWFQYFDIKLTYAE